MSFRLPTSSDRPQGGATWPGLAVMVEAMVLLVFLVVSILVVTMLFLGSAARSKEGRDLAQAVAEATSAAERFANDPAQAAGTTQAGDLRVVCDVSPAPDAAEATAGEAGALYHATIRVFAPGETEPVYTLETARFQPASARTGEEAAR